MLLSTSRLLSLVVTAAAALHVLRTSMQSWYLLVIVVPALLLIWFAEQIDDLTFGTWHHGYLIDTHTPAVLIAGFGWILLIVEAIILMKLRMIGGHLGM